MKKIILSAITIIMIFSLTGCSKLDGQDLVDQVRKDYEKLESGTVQVTNTSTGAVEQSFSFYYDDKGLMHYLYTGIYEKETYTEFYNGVELYTKKNDKVELTERGDKNFQKYTKKNPHPNATEGIILFIKNCVGKTTYEEIDSGTEIHYFYDMEKLGKKMTLDTEEGNLIEFDTTFFFDKDGKLIELLERSVFEKDGEKTEHVYSVTVKDENEITSLENPIKE